MTAQVTLLICTRNRAPSLAATLASITRAATVAQGIAIEVIVVDNGSSDETPSLLRQWQSAQPFPVRLLREDRPGLARARNVGLAHRNGAIIAMTDDDCILHANYFTALAKAFDRPDGPMVIGGRILLGNPADLPVTIKVEDHPMVAPPGGFPGGFVMGANLAMHREVLDRIGLFDERFGAGAPFIAAEDTDLLFRASGVGIPIRYDPAIIVDHHHGRRHIAEETRLLAGYSFGDGALYAKHLLKDRRILRSFLTDIRNLRLDITRPVRVHTGIPKYYRFCLTRKLRGFLFFLWTALKTRLQSKQVGGAS